MTEEHFKDSVASWDDLHFFWEEHRYVGESFPEIFPSSIILRRLLSDIAVAELNGADWEGVQRKLAYIENGDYYERRGVLDYVSLDGDDFNDYKCSTLEWAKREGIVRGGDSPPSYLNLKGEFTALCVAFSTFLKALQKSVQIQIKKLFYYHNYTESQE